MSPFLAATADPSPHAFLDVPGEMAALMRAKDWTATPFGPVEGWSQALRSAVSICLGSRFPMVLYWGPTRALIYNDAWAPVPGQKHPWALGRPGAEVWSEIWDIIGPMFDHVFNTGEATWSQDQLLPLNRFGYVEECYFYYSYSPVRGEDGAVEGIFTAVTETTYRVLSERRERLLREVAEAAARLNTPEEAAAAAAERLAAGREDAPFVLVYLHDPATAVCRRAACVGIDGGNEALAPAVIAPGADPTPWRLRATLESGSQTITGLERFEEGLSHDPWPEPVQEAVATPILSARLGAPYGVLVTGASSRRRVDSDYVTLFERAAGHLSTAIANARAYEEERARAERLAELDRAKTAFFSNASHEFRTPLTLMLGPVEDMLARTPLDVESVEVRCEELKLVERNGQRLLRLVNTLLDFSRLEAGRMQARFEPADLSAYTAELAATFRSAMARAGLSYRVDCPPLSRPVFIDREMWEKVVLNLLSNALKYTLQGEVEVSLREENGRAVLRVRDTGVGIPEAELERVFERFHRVEGQAGRTHEGTGIGLALVRDLVGLHQGEASVSPGPRQGSCFSVSLPFDHAPAAIPAGAPPRQSTATGAGAFLAEALRWLPDGENEEADESGGVVAGSVTPTRRGGGGRVLVADDNADMRGYVARLLTECGYEVQAVADGRAAMEAVADRMPDLVLSDVMMPRLDGFGLLAGLRGDPRTSGLPIILLSARAGEEAAIEGLAAGADDYLMKPFSARELLARVEGALRLAELRGDTAERLRSANEALEERVEERTRERDRFWRLSRDLIGVADDKGVWVAVNPAWTRTLGWTADEIVGRTSEWMEHPDDRVKTREEVGRLAEGAETVDFENRFRARDGEYRALQWTAVPEGGLLYCVARDVTLERQRAADLATAQEQLRQAQKMEAVGQLTGGIAHDFNNLLTGVTGSLELLQTRVAQGRFDAVERYVAAASGAARRAASLTQRLLAFSRRQTLDPKPANLNRLVSDMEDLIRRSVGPAITVEVVGAAGLWPVMVDINQLENALLNLCINARDAMPEGGRITVETANKWLDDRAAKERDLPSGQYVSLCVTDTGTGISPELVDRVFDPFFTTKPLGQGTGLGLSMIYGFVRQSGGQVRVYSELDQGTTMCLYLPRHHGEGEMEASDAAIRSNDAEGGGRTVLVVDDEPTVRMLVAEVLEDTGYRVLEAAEGSAGLGVLTSNARVDLLITDVGLPGGMNGRQLADAALLQRPKLQVLFITGYAENAAVGNGHLEPGMQLLTKPFTLDALRAKVREIID